MSIFTTERLTVRLWTDADVDRLFDLYSRPEVVRFLSSVPDPLQNLTEAHDLIERWQECAVGDRFGYWAVQTHDVVVGTVLLWPIPRTKTRRGESAEGEVGWHLHPDSRGRGYATEAAAGAIAKGFNEGMTAVYANVLAENAASIEVCRRLGMEHTVRERSDPADGEWFRIQTRQTMRAGKLGSLTENHR